MKTLLKVSAIILIAGFVLAFIGFASVGFDIRKLDGVELERTEYTSEIEVFNKIEIDVESTDINVLPAPRGEGTRIVIEDDVDAEYEISFDDGVLSIERDDVEWYEHLAFGQFEKTYISVYLPVGDQGRLEVEATTSDVSISGENADGRISFESIDVDLTTGDVDISASSKSFINVSATTGDVTLRDSDANSITVDVSTGDVEIERVTATGSLKIDATSGDVEVDHSDAGSVYIETTTGDVSAYFVRRMNVDADNTTGEREIKASDPSGGYCKIRCTTGDIEVGLARDGYDGDDD